MFELGKTIFKVHYNALYMKNMTVRSFIASLSTRIDIHVHIALSYPQYRCDIRAPEVRVRAGNRIEAWIS